MLSPAHCARTGYVPVWLVSPIEVILSDAEIVLVLAILRLSASGTSIGGDRPSAERCQLRSPRVCPRLAC
jgi:hypothetical protein